MPLKLFGLLKRRTPAGEPELEFEEVPAPPGTKPAAKPAPQPAAKSAKPVAKKAKGPLTPKQKAQRKYAANMKQVRKRAKTTSGGKGRIANRGTATKMRKQLGLKPGKASGKKTKKPNKKR